jgi:hypothetical protein
MSALPTSTRRMRLRRGGCEAGMSGLLMDVSWVVAKWIALRHET